MTFFGFVIYSVVGYCAVIPHRFVGAYQRFGGIYCVSLHGGNIYGYNAVG